MMKKVGGIESEGGSLLSFVGVGGDAGRKGKHNTFSLQCLIYCDNGILTQLLLKSGKRLYTIIST